MALVDYNSDSDSGSGSGSEAETPAPSKAAPSTSVATAKKPFQKIVDRANPGKILVSLPTAAAGHAKEGGDDAEDGRPAKRARVGGGGSSRFSGFGSFLPPPKKTTATTATTATTTATTTSSSTSPFSQSSSSTPARAAVNLKTSSEAAFARRGDDSVLGDVSSSSSASSAFIQSLPPPKAPSIPRDQKAADEVKLVGNPLMFMPLSVSRKPKKKAAAAAAAPQQPPAVPAAAAAPVGESTEKAKSSVTSSTEAPPAAKKKVSLFSLGVEEPAPPPPDDDIEADDNANAPVETAAQATDYTSTYGAVPAATYNYDYTQEVEIPPPQNSSSLDAFADDMQLSAKERRELFGRRGAAAPSAQISATFNMDQEYRHNEQLRQSGEADAQLQARSTVRTLMPGKHSLKQLVDAVHTQKEALEETFAKNRASQRDAGGRYGWR